MKRLGLGVIMMLFFAMNVHSFDNLAARGLVAMPKDGGSVFLSWRYLREDTSSTSFAIYRKTSGSYSKITTVNELPYRILDFIICHRSLWYNITNMIMIDDIIDYIPVRII